MTPETTVTGWIDQLKAGRSSAVQKLWEGYFGRMVRLARHRLADAPRAAADEEDVALSAFDSFCRGVQAGRFPQLVDRHALWPLLVAITSHKLLDLRRREGRQKRGGHWNRVNAGDANSSIASLEELVSHEPTPQFACQMADEFRRLLEVLGDETLRSITVWRLEGDSIEEIAQRLNCVPRTVLRKLDRIRTLWSEETSHDAE
ncbi:MAG: ECF-type sigma factor [Planctomycetaceae bacterium]